MRVIAGELKGQRLVAPRGWKVRPTSDRVREAIFSALGEVAGARVLDLYCGTGALAIEALSRGAATALLVDRDTRPALGNVERLGLGERAELVRADVPRWLESQSGTAGPDPSPGNSRERGPGEGSGPAIAPVGRFDLVFVDAPYRLADRVGQELNTHLPRLLATGGRAIVESGARRPLRLDSLEPLRQRRYGAADVSFYGRRQDG
jgi:16S rRNA (guanine966-N2)-methyltransferase